MPPLKKKKTSQLVGADTPLTGAEIVRIGQGGLNRQTTTQDIADLGSGGGELQTVKVLNVHTQANGNVGTAETVLDEHVLQEGILANDGESLFGNFYGSFVGNTATARYRLYLINNGVTTEVLNPGAMSAGTSGGFIINFEFVRVDANRVKTIARIHTPTNSTTLANRYLDITGLDLSLPLTIQLTGTAAGSGAASDKMTAQFSKIFWAATA